MQLMVNGKAEIVEGDNISVADLLAFKQVESPDMVSVQRNGKIVDRQRYAEQALAEGDEIEFLYFMGGGARR
ncbi:MAG: thiamine biosynthesis protein ThiS [Deltaproteobacteria bacterium RIFOXYD12_FULL_56_24]|nr:MAG: thiamine biosynthesis protein ThiS [Deltaproteobacteria bacterium RIFOXYD12_FULL_56_24]